MEPGTPEAEQAQLAALVAEYEAEKGPISAEALAEAEAAWPDADGRILSDARTDESSTYYTNSTCPGRVTESGDAVRSAVHYDSYTEARAHLRALLDAAENGRVVTIRREQSVAAVVDADRLRRFLMAVTPSHAEAVPEADGWAVYIPGLPVAADGAGFDEAVGAMVDALREYAEDWQDHLLDAPNHRDNWGLMQLVSLSDDIQLRAWITGQARGVRPLPCGWRAPSAGNSPLRTGR